MYQPMYCAYINKRYEILIIKMILICLNQYVIEQFIFFNMYERKTILNSIHIFIYLFLIIILIVIQKTQHKYA